MIRIAAAAFVLTLVWTPVAYAHGASVAFDGGNRFERSQVAHALAVSAFDWGVLPERVTVHIRRGVDSYAAPDNVWLDSQLLDAGRFAWGVVQHEFAHQVDFLLLDEAARVKLESLLGGKAWCWSAVLLEHTDYGCERFASTLAWAYWPNPDNCMKPLSKTDESAAMAPAAFRQELAELLPGAAPPRR